MMSQSAICMKLLSMAERELAAFLRAVEESYGPQQAALSAEDWLEEFESFDRQPEITDSDWRQVTIAAAVRLANRLTATNTKVWPTPSSNRFAL